MKKIMFTLAAVACAATMQAAQFSWAFSNVRDGWNAGENKVGGTAYLFLVGGDVTTSSIASTISGASDASALATALGGKAIDTKAVEAGAGGGESPKGIDATAPADVFFVVISGDNVYQSGTLQLTTIETLGATEVAFGSQKSASSAASAPIRCQSLPRVCCFSLVVLCSRCAGSRSKQTQVSLKPNETPDGFPPDVLLL